MHLASHSPHRHHEHQPRPLCTKEVIYNHDIVYINSDDFSNSPSFLKMSLDNTPALDKKKDSLFSSSRETTLRNNTMLVNLMASPSMEGTLRKESLKCGTPPATDKKRLPQNKQNVHLENPANLHWQKYSVGNLIQLVDNMYQRAVNRKIHCSVDMQLHHKSTTLPPPPAQPAAANKKSIRIQLEKLKLMQKCRQRFGNGNGKGNEPHPSSQECCQIIDEEEKEDRCLSTTQRVSIEMLPESEWNEHRCKQEDEADEREKQESQKQGENGNDEAEQCSQEWRNKLEVSSQYLTTQKCQKLDNILIKDMQAQDKDKVRLDNTSYIKKKEPQRQRIVLPRQNKMQASKTIDFVGHTEKSNGAYKGVYEQILSEYSTAKLLAISKSQFKANNSNISKSKNIMGRNEVEKQRFQKGRGKSQSKSASGCKNSEGVSLALCFINNQYNRPLFRGKK